MITIEKALANIFNRHGISRANLLAYAKDHLGRIKSKNTTGVYDLIIAYLTPLISAFETEMQVVDSAKNLRKGQTHNVEETTGNFSGTMGSYKEEIGRKLGGKTSVAFFEFYPNNQSEYSQPNRKEMDAILSRITVATNKHHVALGTELTAVLLALKPDYTASRGAQTETIADVAANKADVTANQLALANGLNKSFHEIAAKHTDNIAPCIGLFNFNLLYSVTHHQHTVFTGTVLITKEVTVLNRSLDDNMQIVAKNTTDNADFWIWNGAIPFDPEHVKAVLVKAGKSVNLKASDIGDVNNPFLTIKNASTVNTVGYEVTIIG
ncbi:MAG: hypothetical protein WCP65_00660 [Bacteroidota bacterium]